MLIRHHGLKAVLFWSALLATAAQADDTTLPAPAVLATLSAQNSVALALDQLLPEVIPGTTGAVVDDGLGNPLTVLCTTLPGRGRAPSFFEGCNVIAGTKPVGGKSLAKWTSLQLLQKLVTEQDAAATVNEVLTQTSDEGFHTISQVLLTTLGGYLSLECSTANSGSGELAQEFLGCTVNYEGSPENPANVPTWSTLDLFSHLAVITAPPPVTQPVPSSGGPLVPVNPCLHSRAC